MPRMRQEDEDSIADSLRQFDQMPDAGYVSVKVCARLFDIGVASIWRWVKAGTFPAPKQIGGNTTRWNVGEVRAFMKRTQAGS